jgi:ATP-dependent Clp protease ATP-binding subunit ClpB
MKYDKFTQRSQDALQSASEMARSNANSRIESLHFLAALLSQEDSFVAAILEKAEVEVSGLKAKVANEIGALSVTHVEVAEAHVSPELNKSLKHAQKEAMNFKDKYVSVEHLLLAMIEMDRTKVHEIFMEFGIEKPKVLAALVKLRSQHHVAEPDSES